MRASKEILDNIRYIEIDNSSDERLTLKNVFDESGLEIKNKDEIVESLIERHEKKLSSNTGYESSVVSYIK